MIRHVILAWAGALLLAGTTGPATAFGCLPIYGNWCGPGHPRQGTPPPVDAFDAACMRHDLCTATGAERPCDLRFVGELRALAAQYGGLPRPLQWAEYVVRLKAGGPAGGMPMPSPGDAFGLLTGLAGPCR